MTKIKTWQDVYKFPLKYDGYSYAFSENDVMSLMFDSKIRKEDRLKIVESINGNNDLNIDGLTKEGCDFYQDGNYIFCVRGWGHLTGGGALNFNQEKALKIQNGFIDYIFEKLTKKEIINN